MEPLKNEKYDIMNNIVEDIYKDSVKLNSQEKEALVKRVNNVIDNLLQVMKRKDRMFDKTYNKIGYTGSFYDRLKVGEADEYDLNLILKPKLKMEPIKTGYQPGFVALKVLGYNEEKEWYMNNWMTNDFLNPQKVKRWLEGVITKSLNELKENFPDCSIRFVKSGPAMTLKISSRNALLTDISIDMVPVFPFPSNQWPFINRKSKRVLKDAYEEPWFSIPKGEDNWRISFPIQERSIMKSAHFLKYTLRLIKKVRDELGITQVCSYYIKTMFLWELEKNERIIWEQYSRGRLFMHMLHRFREVLRDQKIPFYWNDNLNLIGDLNKIYLVDCYGQLNNFIRKIDQYVTSNDVSALNQYIKKRLISSEV